MMIPPPELAEELTDICGCGNREQPVAVNGHSDSPTAAYKCAQDGTIWFSDWHRTYKKLVSDTVSPIKPTSSGLDLTQNPSCQQCQSPLGQPHAPACPYNQYPASPQQIGQVSSEQRPTN